MLLATVAMALMLVDAIALASPLRCRDPLGNYGPCPGAESDNRSLVHLVVFNLGLVTLGFVHAASTRVSNRSRLTVAAALFLVGIVGQAAAARFPFSAILTAPWLIIAGSMKWIPNALLIVTLGAPAFLPTTRWRNAWITGLVIWTTFSLSLIAFRPFVWDKTL